MPEPSPAATNRWKVATIALATITAVMVTLYIKDQLDSDSITWLGPRIMQISILLMAATTVAVSNRWIAGDTRAEIKAHVDRRSWEARALIDRRVMETARRMDNRMAVITRAMEAAGLQIEENTGELRRIGSEYEITGYSRGYADGRTGSRFYPDAPTAGLDPNVLEMGERIARRLHEN